MAHNDGELYYIKAEHLISRTDDLSSAYKVIIRHKGNVNTNVIKRIITDLYTLKTEYKCKLKYVTIIGDSIDRRAFVFMQECRKNKFFKMIDFEFSDTAFPKRGLKLYFYVNGKIEYIGVDDAEYKKGDYFEISELKEDIYQLYPDIPKSELIPFYVRNWVIFSPVPLCVESAYSEYLDVISESNEENCAYIITLKPNGKRKYSKTV